MDLPNPIVPAERGYFVLDLHGVAHALTQQKLNSNATPKLLEDWTSANKVCRHTILNTLSNELFDVYCSYKKTNKSWESLILKYTAEDVGREKFIIGHYYNWEMNDEKDIKTQINEYNKLLKDMKTEKIILPENFVAGLLIEKLPESWKDYKQQLKHKINTTELITHIIIEDTNRKELKATRVKALTSRTNMIQANNKRHKKRSDNSLKLNANLVEGDDVIVAVISQALLMANVSNWVVDSGATKHICVNKIMFTSYSSVGDGEEQVYLSDSRTA
ncbi:uncharacterized protein LOC113870101 [Abrus precatorius]|uniref:Uncharacterized protein LOC113870101 n=1 Tax=Abrus precatorius TaxID=3816 RepID=A0A8B8M456_ABRPR|nr:uncharacterized protein LOC113870101 [Abrus precatorius]